jgi:hypothetical protein
MMNEAAFANTRAAIVTVKFVAVANVIPAFTAFYGSIDELKHQTISLFELMLEKTFKRFIQSRKMRLSTVSLRRATKKTILLKFFGRWRGTRRRRLADSEIDCCEIVNRGEKGH